MALFKSPHSPDILQLLGNFVRCIEIWIILNLPLFTDVEERRMFLQLNTTAANLKSDVFGEVFALSHATPKETTLARRFLSGTPQYCVFQGPMASPDGLGKTFDIWLDSTPHQCKVYYMRNKRWAEWGGKGFSVPFHEGRRRSLRLYSGPLYTGIGWFDVSPVKGAKSIRTMVRLSCLDTASKCSRYVTTVI